MEVGTWNGLAPRAGVAFDLSGDGKTVVKSTYGWYNFDFELVNFASRYNQNSTVTYNYRWHDLNGDGNYQPGEVNLDLNGVDFLNVTGATNNLINQDLKLPHQHEVTASLERELGKGLSIRGLYVYKRIVDTHFMPSPNRRESGGELRQYPQALQRLRPGVHPSRSGARWRDQHGR